jgi:hypothetical protein
VRRIANAEKRCLPTVSCASKSFDSGHVGHSFQVCSGLGAVGCSTTWPLQSASLLVCGNTAWYAWYQKVKAASFTYMRRKVKKRMGVRVPPAQLAILGGTSGTGEPNDELQALIALSGKRLKLLNPASVGPAHGADDADGNQ